MQEIIAIEEVKENILGVQNEGGLRMVDQAELADVHFR